MLIEIGTRLGGKVGRGNPRVTARRTPGMNYIIIV